MKNTNQLLPKRLQRKRKKGFKLSDLSDNYVYVGRPTKWGNPFINIQDITYYLADRRRKLCLSPEVYCCHKSTRNAVELFAEGLKDPEQLGRFVGGYDGKILKNYFENILKSLPELRGKDLACWCKEGAECHADILLKLANR